MYLLLDANVTAGYYLPRSLWSKRARLRIENILQSVRSKATEHFLYIPNICIAEVFSVFIKHAFGAWNPHLKGGTIDKRVYESLVQQFQKDIHNGRFMYHLEVNRYHVLGINLVAPIDHHYRVSRGNKKNVRPMGTFDHLIISMGINLAHIHGRENVCVISADDRLTNILAKCKSTIPSETVSKLKLSIAQGVTGKPFGPEIFPKHVNLKTARDKDLQDLFGEWPLPVAKVPRHYRWTRMT